MTEDDILDLIYKDDWMMAVLKTASSLNLPDWMIGAGFVRNKVWDYLHGYRNIEVPTADIDLIYFDKEDISEASEKKYDSLLCETLNLAWSVKNQARMYLVHNRQNPYNNTEDALSEWVETATCVAVQLDQNGDLKLFAPHGIYDLVHLIVRPNSAFTGELSVFQQRVQSKKWLRKWPKLRVEI